MSEKVSMIAQKVFGTICPKEFDINTDLHNNNRWWLFYWGKKKLPVVKKCRIRASYSPGDIRSLSHHSVLVQNFLVQPSVTMPQILQNLFVQKLL